MPTTNINELTQLSLTRATIDQKRLGNVIPLHSRYFHGASLGLPMQSRPPYHLPRSQFDYQLMSTVRHCDQWRNVVWKAASKFALYDMHLEARSQAALVRIQELVLHANFGRGWVDFATQIAYDWLLCSNGWFAEIIRASPAAGSRVMGIARLNPLQCKRTNNIEFPVEFHRADGETIRLGWWQVMHSNDLRGMPYSSMICASESAWGKIYSLAAINEKVAAYHSGDRWLGIKIISNYHEGLFDQAAENAEEKLKARQGLYQKGWLMLPAASDDKVSLEEIPFIERPDPEEVAALELMAYHSFANAVGIEPMEAHPDLTSKAALDNGALAELASEHAESAGLAELIKGVVHQLNRRDITGSSSIRLFVSTQNDKLARARTEQVEIQNAGTLVNELGLEQQQARNRLADRGVIAEEFGAPDNTTAAESEGDKVEDDN